MVYTIEHLIFGESGTPFTPSQSPLTEVAPDGDSEKAKLSRLVLTSALLNALPTSEANAFRELIWASATQHLRDQPKVLSPITQMCDVLSENLWPALDASIGEKFESDPELKEFVDSLSDEGENTS